MDFYLLLKIWVEILAKFISKNLSSKYNQKLIDNAKQSATDALKTSVKRAIQKTAEAPPRWNPPCRGEGAYD